MIARSLKKEEEERNSEPIGRETRSGLASQSAELQRIGSSTSVFRTPSSVVGSRTSVRSTQRERS